MDPEHYYTALAAAYVRGSRPDLAAAPDLAAGVDGADADADLRLLLAAKEHGLRLHRFKRTAGLPRVRRVLGALKGFGPASLLDVGSGRGAFLWPLLDELPTLEVTAIDLLQHRVDDINAVRRGGVARVQARLLGAEALPWPADAFDAVTILEVLEHVADPAPVAAEVVRVARAVVIATVPAKEDDNPEHIRLFTRDSLAALFRHAGAAEVKVEHVLNHMVAVVRP
ncbi:class I SAM-dependent methyltransferase [Haliangium sp.]|uniref:class I SAM-dependent methyltransferase n=1 Tax=Haliangium sp. TaxID=2663208 RepID=UPI003D0D7696